jgi:hypothetical protein
VVTVRKKDISKGTVLREKLQKPEKLRKTTTFLKTPPRFQR